LARATKKKKKEQEQDYHMTLTALRKKYIICETVEIFKKINKFNQQNFAKENKESHRIFYV
jgi:hypothetical protein